MTIKNVRLLLTAIVFVSAFSVIGFATAQEITLNTAAPEYRIVDGDSINYGHLHFRLCGIQAPERNAFFYEGATDMLRKLASKGLIAARLVDVDKYGRQVVVIRKAARPTAKTINEQMVIKGGAKHYKRFSKNCVPYISRKALTKAEKSARRKSWGMWKEE